MGGFFFYFVVPLLLSAVMFPVLKTIQSGDPLSHMYPNFLLFTNLRELTKEVWVKTLTLGEKIAPKLVTEIDAADFSMEAMAKATNGWRSPAIVRGLFKGTPATEHWQEDGYLSSKLGDYGIPAVRNAKYGTLQNDRAVIPFREAFTEIISDTESKMYLFFPVKSRFSFNHSELGALEELQKKINEIVLEDLEIDKRIWNGFGTSQHSTYFGSQLIIGRGTQEKKETTGTGWHCAMGNNWFIQVKGSKRWYFMDPKYSAGMHPLRGGKVNMQTGSREMSKFQEHLPIRYADITEGDLLYNPDWQWHTIQNHGGLSMGVPIREVNMTLSFQNNFQYTSIVMVNKFLELFDLDIGGYPQS